MPSGWWRKEEILGLDVQFGGGFQTGTLDPRSLAPSRPECQPNPASSVLLQLCLGIANLVQGLNVHLGTLIGKTWEPREKGRDLGEVRGPPRPFEAPLWITVDP